MKYRNKLMALIRVLKNRLSRQKDKCKDLELLVEQNAASPIQKKHYIQSKARIEEIETIIDLAEGLLDDNEKAES